MATGEVVRVVKHSHDGRPPVAYQGQLISGEPGWIIIQATWSHGFYEFGDLTFQNGDRLTEYFSFDQPYNAFRICRPDHGLVGWYCNVTGPLERVGDEISWHDRYIDVIWMPDGRLTILDEDELDQSRIAIDKPRLYQEILAGRDELIRQIQAGCYPFSIENLDD